MKRIVFILLLIADVSIAQNKTVTIEECYNNTLITYPLSAQKHVYEKSTELAIKNLKSGWLPHAELDAQATYQSDAIEINISAMGNSFGFTGEKDQYKATINVNQLIYDWGRIKSAELLESANHKVNQQNTVVELNKIKEQVNKFFFAILILERNEELLNVMLKELQTKELKVESGVSNGVLLASDLYSIKAEKIKINQSIVEIKNQRYAAIDVLAEITGMALTYEDHFEVPQLDIDETASLNRPELTLFAYQKEKMDAKTKIVSKQNKPTVFSFAQLGYGKPGLNMVNNEFDSFYYLGFGLKWSFWDWNRSRREKQIIELNKDLIASQESTFGKNIIVALKNESAKIKTVQESIASDIEIIKLREEVTKSARSRLDNGTITSTDYITELSKETQAKINYETHKIQLVQSKVNYLYLKGEL